MNKTPGRDHAEQYELRYLGEDRYYGWVLWLQEGGKVGWVEILSDLTKEDALEQADFYCSRRFEMDGIPCRLMVCKESGLYCEERAWGC